MALGQGNGCVTYLILSTASRLGLDETVQRHVKLMTPDWHLHRVEGILHDEIGVQLVDLAYDDLDVGLRGLRQHQELCARGRLEAVEPKVRGLEHLDAGRPHGEAPRHGVGGVQRGGRQRARDGVHAVKCAGEDEQVVAAELRQAAVELAVVDQPAGLVDDEERVDDPVWSAVVLMRGVAHILLAGLST
jgi:hypothetical protein